MAAAEAQQIRLTVPRSSSVGGYSTVSVRQMTPGETDMGFFAMIPFNRATPPIGLTVSGALRFETIATLQEIISRKIKLSKVVRKSVEIQDVHRMIPWDDKILLITREGFSCLVEPDELMVAVDDFDVSSAPTGVLIHGATQEWCSIDYALSDALIGAICTDFTVNADGTVEVDKRCVLQNYSTLIFDNVVTVAFKDTQSSSKEDSQEIYSVSRSPGVSYSSSSRAPPPVSRTSMVSYNFNPPLHIGPQSIVGASLGSKFTDPVTFILVLEYTDEAISFTPAVLVPRQIQRTFLPKELVRLRGTFGEQDVLHDTIYIKKTSNVEDSNLLKFSASIPSLARPLTRSSVNGSEKVEVFEDVVVPHEIEVVYAKGTNVLLQVETANGELEPEVPSRESSSFDYWTWYKFTPGTEHILKFKKQQ